MASRLACLCGHEANFAIAAKPTLAILRSVEEEETRSLAKAGKIGRGDAHENAVAAGKCVEVGVQ